MRQVLLPTLVLALGAIILGGCSSSAAADDATVKDGSGKIMNPGGKPANDAEATRDSQMQKQGQQQAAAASKDSQAMQEAMKRTGGK